MGEGPGLIESLQMLCSGIGPSFRSERPLCTRSQSARALEHFAHGPRLDEGAPAERFRIVE